MTPRESAQSVRIRQTRRFDTTDRTLVLQSCLQVLQDLGYEIKESQATVGVVVALKQATPPIRVQIGVSDVKGGMVVRVTFQSYGNLSINLDDPVLYRGFFEKLSQSLFLTAHDI